jgi:hypothetical protein
MRTNTLRYEPVTAGAAAARVEMHGSLLMLT